MSNLMRHEMIGLVLLFLAGACAGIGLYFTIWFAVRPLFYQNIAFAIRVNEFLLLPIFYGAAAVLWSFGRIELKESGPNKPQLPK